MLQEFNFITIYLKFNFAALENKYNNMKFIENVIYKIFY